MKYLNKFYNLVVIKDLKNSIKVNTIINSIDLFILIIVIFALVGDFIFLVSSIFNHLFEIFNTNGYDFISYMVEGNTTTPTKTSTIIHNDGSWGNAVRSIFIYGTGAFRLNLLKNGGTPGSRAFIIVSTCFALLSCPSLPPCPKMVNNTINDPSYVRNHYLNWKAIWEDSNEGRVSVEVDADTLSKLSNACLAH